MSLKYRKNESFVYVNKQFLNKKMLAQHGVNLVLL